MDNGVHRVELGGSYPGGLVPKARARREGDSQEFERELQRKTFDKQSESEQKDQDQELPTSELHISPPSTGDPGSLLDLTA